MISSFELDPERSAFASSTSPFESPPSRPSRRGRFGRRCAQLACAGVLGVLGVAMSSSPVSASPGVMYSSALQAPLEVASITGLQQGAQGEEVAALQRALLAAGVQVPGGADGIFGPMTRNAVRSFQQANALDVTGVVDSSTADRLAAASGSASSGSGHSSESAAAPSTGVVGLAQGAQGANVKVVQQALMDLGVFVPGGADGVFGPATTKAVTQFQRWNTLQVTGTVTQATANRLGLGESGAAPAATPQPVSQGSTNGEAQANPYVGLKIGSTGNLVKDLQSTLIATGITVRGGADGSFGPVTQAALKTFQARNGLPQTGVVSFADASALHLGSHDHDHSDPAAPTAPAPATPAPTAPAPTAEDGLGSPYLGMTVGARGERVKNVQRAIISSGINLAGGADGVFGNVTKGGLAMYQQRNGIPATGIVNRATLAAMNITLDAPVGVTNPTPAPAPTTPPTPQSPSSSNPYVGLTVGAQGDLVRDLQRALQRTGLVVRGGADGDFGPATRSALVAFQSVNDIAQTGVVTERGARILGLGTTPQGATNPDNDSSAPILMDRFPVQGPCWFGDTWHAPRSGGRKHEGVDVIAKEGNLLYAVVDGHISKMYWDFPGALAGNGLRVAQDDGTYFTYLHLSAFAPGIEVGTEVKAGDVIGYIGNTGSSATPHLHFEIHPGGGAAVNPYPYVKAIDDCKNTTAQHQQSFPSPD